MSTINVAIASRNKIMFESTIISNGYPVSVPDVNKLITEDDTPVDNFASAKQQRFLVSSLYSYALKPPFLAEANVGIFSADEQPAIVPDVFLSLDVQVPENWWEKQNRSYLMWKFGKPPDVVIEIVSNKEGGGLGLTIWAGKFEEREDIWWRWCD
ncbi:MAG: Uma2 family endonuclease, partial [Microcystaceae cyanobacterium]